MHSMPQSAKRLRVLVFAPSFAPGYKGGGVQTSVVALVEGAPPDTEVLVITTDRDTGDDAPYPGLSGQLVQRGAARVLYIDPRNRKHWQLAVRTSRSFAPDVTYLNSLWHRSCALLPAALMVLRVLPRSLVVAAPRGQLHAGALQMGNRRMKSVVLPLWRSWAARPGHVFHCSDKFEEIRLKERVPRARCVLSLDPVQLPEDPLSWRPPARRDRLEVVHVSRVTEKKGQHLLLAALASVQRPVRLRVVGPLEDAGYAAGLRASAAGLPKHVQVEFTGPVPPGTIRDHFAAADVFAFPTLGENFGHVIPEALSASCPVLAGPDTPFSDVLRGGGGEVLDPRSPLAWAEAIERWAALSDTDLAEAHADAGSAYRRWRRTRDESHVFDLFRELLSR